MDKEKKNKIRDTDNKSYLTALFEIAKGIGMDKLLIIAICGVVLVLLSIPSSGSKSKETQNETQTTAGMVLSEHSISSNEYVTLLERKLEQFLLNVEGIGNVKVMITLEDYGEKIVLSEKPYSKSGQEDTDSQGGKSTKNEYSQEEQVVYEKDSQGNEIPYVVKNKQPEIKGIAVIAQGGNDAKMVVKITNLIQALFGVAAHKISVIGMSK